jgi:hypothetical protein
VISAEDLDGGAAVRARVADLSARFVTNRPAVIAWVQRYLGAWWPVEAEPATATTAADVTVFAGVDGARFRQVAIAVDALSPDPVSYARTELRLAHHDDGLVAYGADDVAYVVDRSGIGVVGLDPDRVASAGCRLAKEALRGRLARDGWVLLRASATVHDSHGLLAFAPRPVGRTSTALQLARSRGWAVLAHDRVFARVGPTGQVAMLPWPAAVAVGLGLLDCAGWYDTVSAGRAQLHPRTTRFVLDALAAGQRRPVMVGDREYKAQLFPEQIASLLGLAVATSGQATTVLLPTIDSDTTASLQPGGREIGMDDGFEGVREDRYPNVFGVRDAELDTAHADLFHALNTLPRVTVTLGHELEANQSVLADLP